MKIIVPWVVGFLMVSVAQGREEDAIPNAENPGELGHREKSKSAAPGSTNPSESPHAGGRGAPKRRPRPRTYAPGGPEDSGRGPGLGAPGKPGGPGGPGGPGSPEGPIGLKRGDGNASE